MKKIPPLGSLPVDVFLRDYWQKRPVFIKNAFPDFKSPVSPDELAGLACESAVESRLILEKGGKKAWEVRHGAFKEKDFQYLPATHWTLLVQEVNRHVPEIADLLDFFSFIPQWRIDDLMISYAAPYGSVGAHVDSYDVFLIQATGRRRWQISYQPEDFVPNLELKILKKFEPVEEWIAEAGDILYLPPKVAHYGVALEECMTFSVGFLAPSHAEMLMDYADYISQKMDKSQRYQDPDLILQENSGEITPAQLEKISNIIHQLPLDNAHIAHWFGCFISESRAGNTYECPDPPYTPEEWLEDFRQLGGLHRNARAFFIKNNQKVTLYIEGQAIPLTAELAIFAPLLTAERELTFTQIESDLSTDFITLLTQLTNQGYYHLFEN